MIRKLLTGKPGCPCRLQHCTAQGDTVNLELASFEIEMKCSEQVIDLINQLWFLQSIFVIMLLDLFPSCFTDGTYCPVLQTTGSIVVDTT